MQLSGQKAFSSPWPRVDEALEGFGGRQPREGLEFIAKGLIAFRVAGLNIRTLGLRTQAFEVGFQDLFTARTEVCKASGTGFRV